MQTNNQWRIALAALVMVGGTGTLWAQQGAKRPTFPRWERRVDTGKADVLKGLKGVDILVEFLSPDALQMGLTRERLQSVIELSLRRNGVPVLSTVESLTTIGAPCLYVRIDVQRGVFNVNIALNEHVRLERDPATQVRAATTWERGGSGVHSNDTDFIVKSAERLADKFCLDYLKANPK